jgi:hypothetical protein
MQHLPCTAAWLCACPAAPTAAAIICKCFSQMSPHLILTILRDALAHHTPCINPIFLAVSLLLPSQTVANRLGLQHHPLRGAAVAPIMFGGHSAPVRALTEPLTVQLLAGPGNIAFQITIPVVLVVPSRPEGDQIELQLGLFDFCQEVQFDFLPLWASQFTHVPTGYSWALPVVAPQQRSHYIRTAGTSTFHITQECYDEVRGGGLGGGLGVTVQYCRCTARILCSSTDAMGTLHRQCMSRTADTG